jgi:hypothetical protein
MSSRWRTPRMAPLIAKTNVPPGRAQATSVV